MTCARCEELEEQVAWLKSELGVQRDLSRLAAIERAIPPSRHAGRPQTARFLCALSAANGRVLTRRQLLEACPPINGDDRDDKILDVWVWRSRKWLGKAAIQTIHGRGYQLTEAGRARLDEALAAARSAA